MVQGMVTGVGVMAPAVKGTQITVVNPGLSLGDETGKAAAVNFFAKDYPIEAPLLILGGKKVGVWHTPHEGERQALVCLACK